MLNIRNIGNISNEGNGIILFMACVVLFAPDIVIYLIIQIFQKRKSEYFFISDEVLVVVRVSFRNASHVL